MRQLKLDRNSFYWNYDNTYYLLKDIPNVIIGKCIKDYTNNWKEIVYIFTDELKYRRKLKLERVLKDAQLIHPSETSNTL